MDYGKLAYLRLDELEQKLLFTNKSGSKYKNVYAFIEPRRKIEAGNGFFAARLSGEGALSLIVKIDTDTEKPGTLVLTLDGILAGRVALDAGKTYELIMNSVLAPEGSQLELMAADGLETVILSLEIILTGLNANIARTADAVCMDSAEDIAAVIRGKDERLEYSCGAPDGVLGAPQKNIGFGISCDICAEGRGSFTAVYADSALNLWGLKLDLSGETRRVYLGGGVKSAAVTLGNGRCIVAFTDGARAGYFVADNNFDSVSERVYFELPGKADNVIFVKGAENPSLIINCGGKSYMKTAVKPEAAEDAVMKVRLSVTVEEV